MQPARQEPTSRSLIVNPDALQTLNEHTHWVTALRLLPDGRLASGSGDGTIKIWEPRGKNYACVSTLSGHTSNVQALTSLPDGRLASGSKDETIKIWEPQGKNYARISTLSGQMQWVNALTLLPDGRLASGSYATIKIWALRGENYECVSTLSGHMSGNVYALTLLPDGCLASGSADKTIKIWALRGENYECVSTLSGHKSDVNALTVLPNGVLASGSADKMIRLWNLQNNQCITTLSGHTSAVWSLAALSDGRLASGAGANISFADKAIRIWDVTRATCVAKLEGHTNNVCALTVLQDGRLASGSYDNTIKLWDVGCVPILQDGAAHEKVDHIARDLHSVLAAPAREATTEASGSIETAVVPALTPASPVALKLAVKATSEHTIASPSRPLLSAKERLLAGDFAGFKRVFYALADGNAIIESEPEKETLLHLAVRYEKPEIAFWLLEQCVSPDIQNAEKQTAADLARALKHPAMELLLGKTVDANLALRRINQWIETAAPPVPTCFYLLRAMAYQQLASAVTSSKQQTTYLSHAIKAVELALETDLTETGMALQESINTQLTAVQSQSIESSQKISPSTSQLSISSSTKISSEDIFPPTPPTSSSSAKKSSERKLTDASLISSRDVQTDLNKRLGFGGFGIVYQGIWQMVPVAIKKLHATELSNEALQSFREEAEVHAPLRHPNIVTLWGVCIEPGHYSMVMELMMAGSLYQLLHSKADLPWTRRLSIAQQITIGLHYLHQHYILHRDLKSLNVLLDQHGQAKLADFGLSTVKSETTRTTKVEEKPSSGHAPGTICWMAPELLKRGAQCTSASDIYALGMTFFELSSRKAPFQEEKRATPELLMQWIKDGELDEIPKETPPKFSALITHCLLKNPTERPVSVERIAEALSHADIIDIESQNSMLDSGYQWRSHA